MAGDLNQCSVNSLEAYSSLVKSVGDSHNCQIILWSHLKILEVNLEYLFVVVCIIKTVFIVKELVILPRQPSQKLYSVCRVVFVFGVL